MSLRALRIFASSHARKRAVRILATPGKLASSCAAGPSRNAPLGRFSCSRSCCSSASTSRPSASVAALP